MKFKTATGKEFDYKWVGVAFTGNLTIAIENSNVAEVITMATNPAETAELLFYPDDNRSEPNEENPEIFIPKSGYTRFVGVMLDDGAGTVNLILGKDPNYGNSN